MVLKQLGAGPELVHRHATLTLVLSAVTPALTMNGTGISMQWHNYHQVAVIKITCMQFLYLQQALAHLDV